MVDIQALDQNRRGEKHARRQALRGQAVEELPKVAYGATRPPTAPSSVVPSSPTSVTAVPATAAPSTSAAATVAPPPAATTAAPTTSSQSRKRASEMVAPEVQPSSSRRRHLVDEPSDDEVEIVRVQEDDQAPWHNENFAMPDNRRDCFRLAKKIGDVNTLEKIDIFAHEGPRVLAGRGILQRVAQMDKGPEFMERGSSFLVNRMRLVLSELATTGVALDNLVAHHRVMREEAEKKYTASSQRLETVEKELSVSSRDLVETKGHLLRASSGLQAVTLELRAASSSLQSVTDELSAERQSSEELRARVAELETKVTEVECDLEVSKAREAEVAGQLVRVGQLANSSREAVLAEYLASDNFTMAWMDKVLPYYDQGKFHVMRMAAASGISDLQLFTWGNADHYSEIPRAMHPLIPFSEEEIDNLRQREPEWSPPPVLAHNIPYLLEVARAEGTVEKTPEGWRVEPAADSDEEDAVMAESAPPLEDTVMGESAPPSSDI